MPPAVVPVKIEAHGPDAASTDSNSSTRAAAEKIEVGIVEDSPSSTKSIEPPLTSETTNEEIMGLIKSLQSTVEAQGAEIKELKSKEHGVGVDHPIEKLEDLYSYSLEMLIYPDSAGGAAMLTVKLTAMVLIQILLAFGFYDASVLMIFQGNSNLLGGPISESSFYPDASISYAPQGNAVPTINVITSVVGLLLICQAMHKDVMAVLFYPPPLALFMHIRSMEKTKTPTWRLLACVLLQLAWAVRTVFLPVAAALGTANLMASADSAVDVVLNSVAVAFVFDLDEMAYETLISPDEQHLYKESPSRLPKVIVPSVSKATSNFRVGWLCYLFDVAFTVYVYCYASWQLPFNDNGFDEMAQATIFLAYCVVRGVLWAALHVYRNVQAMQRLKRMKKPIGSTSTIVTKWAVGVIICITSGLASYVLCFLIMDPAAGAMKGLADLDGASPLALCLGAWVPDENCGASAVMFVPHVAPVSVTT